MKVKIIPHLLILMSVLFISIGYVKADECAFDYEYAGSDSNWGGGDKRGTIRGSCDEVSVSYAKYQQINSHMHVYRLSNIYAISGASQSGDGDDQDEYYRQEAQARRERQEDRRRQEEARRRAEAEDLARKQQQKQSYSAAYSKSLEMVQGRVIAPAQNKDRPDAIQRVPLQENVVLVDRWTGGAKKLSIPVPAIPPGRFKPGDDLSESEGAAPFSKLYISPEAFAILGLIGKNIKEAPSKFGEMVIAAVGADSYLSVVKLNKGLREEAERSINKAVDLGRRGWPEEETREFVNGAETRNMKIFIDNMSSIPTPEDDKELEADGRRWFSWAAKKIKREKN
jgi:hypothetical protein